MEFVKSLASRVVTAASGPSFPYTTGERADGLDWTSIWALHEGTKRDDGTPVSVFVFDAVKQKDKLVFARNALKRFKTIRHPSILHYLDSQETDDKIIVVTEHVEPLANQLKDGHKNDNLITWGLYKLATLLKFLNMDSGIVHGNVRISSIFTTKSGEWKLAGLELTGSLKEDNAMVPLYGGQLPDQQRYAPPEVRKASWGVVRSNPVSCTDAYSYGCLIHEVYNGPFSRPEQLGQSRERIPQPLFPYYRSLLDPNPSSRLNFAGLMDVGMRPGSFFDTDFIQTANFLETINLKEQSEKERFVTQLVSKIDRFPDSFAKHKVLPELVNALEFGAGGAKMISPILKLGESLPKDDYDRIVLGALVKMFSSPERQMRVALLDNLPKFADRFEGNNNKLVNEKIFPEIAKGFNDTSGVMREYTLKSMLVIVPKLSERVVNNDLLRYLAKLQVDEEPGIRTNTTILLGKISKYLNESTRIKVLIPAFVRSMRDPFPPSRHAGLLSIGATVDYHEPSDLAQKAIPAISPLLLDPVADVRSQAFKALEISIKKLEKAAAAIPIPEPQAAPPNGIGAQGGGPAGPQAAAGGSDWIGWAGSAVAGMSYSLASTVVGQASNMIAGSSTSPQTTGSSAPTPAAKPASSVSPSEPVIPPALAPPSSFTTSPSEPVRRQQSSTGGGMSLGMKPIVSLPEASDDMWGDWGTGDVETSRESTDNWANFADSESTSPARVSTEKPVRSSPAAAPAGRSAGLGLAPPMLPTTLSQPVMQPTVSNSNSFADFSAMKPTVVSKPSLPPPMAPTAVAPPVSKPSLPPPMAPNVSKPVSTSSPITTPPSEVSKPPTDWADAWMQDVKSAPKAGSDRDKKKDERSQRLAELRAKSKAGSGSNLG